jgi:hypothetical protein
MGDWGEPVKSFLNGDRPSDPSDFASLMGSEVPGWHPSQVSPPSAEQSVDRHPMREGDAQMIANNFERMVSDDYSGKNIGDGKDSEGEADVVVGLNDRAYGWPIQVKSCLMYRKDQSSERGFRPGVFKFRWHNYKELPDESFIDLNIYGPAQDDSEGLTSFTVERTDEEETSMEELDVELYGKMLVPKTMLEDAVPDISRPPEEEGSSWYSNGVYELDWRDVFGEQKHDSAVYIQMQKAKANGQPPNHELDIYM